MTESAEFLSKSITKHLQSLKPACLPTPSAEELEFAGANGSWRSVKAHFPCGSLYPAKDGLIEHSQEAIKKFETRPAQKLAVVDWQTITRGSLASYPYCMPGGADAWTLDLLGLVGKPHDKTDRWCLFLVDMEKKPGALDSIIGVIVTEGVFALDLDDELEVVVDLSAVFVGPEYRGYGYGPVLAASFGYMLGQSLESAILSKPNAVQAFDSITVTVHAEAETDAELRCAEALCQGITLMFDESSLSLEESKCPTIDVILDEVA